MYQLFYHKAAAKTLVKMPRPTADAFRSAFATIASGMANSLDIKPLQGVDGFRLRIGGWRAVYQIDSGRMIVTILKIASRGDIYK